MKKLVRVLVMILVVGLFFAACDNSKAKEKSQVTTKEIENKKDTLKKNDTTDHGYEIAMASYQCPMKCEGETSYQEEGTCPKCKMDLKKVEVEQKDAEEGHQHKE